MATINEQLSASGIAQVIVVLKSPPAAPVAALRRSGGMTLDATADYTPHLAGLESCFECSDLSINHALARAGMRNVAAIKAGRTTARTAKRTTAPAALHFPNLGLMLGTVTRDGLSTLRKDERVHKVVSAPQPRLIRPVRSAPAKLTAQVTWGIKFLNIPKLWDQGLTGKGIRIAHLDTGVDGKHPALRTAIASFAEFDSFGQIVTPTLKPHDTDDHGTHTAATIAGRAVRGKSVGVAPDSDLVSAIVIEGGNVIARLLGGMDWAVSQNVRILNMSVGIPLSPPMAEFDPILQTLRARNILPVIAVGNEGPGTSRTPSNNTQPLSVGAIDKNKAVADFSCSQRFVRTDNPLVPDLVAPGVDILSAQPGGGYQLKDGSSMATPHVAGLAALLFQALPNATISDVQNAIYNSCTAEGIPPERGNRGFPDAVRALAALTGTVVGAATTKSAKAAPASTSKSGATKAKKSKKSIKKRSQQ